MVNMSYPTYWKAIKDKLNDFSSDIKRVKHNRKPVKISIEFHHKTFGSKNSNTVTLDLTTVEMEVLVNNIEQTIRLREMELQTNIEKYEESSREKKREVPVSNTVGKLDTT